MRKLVQSKAEGLFAESEKKSQQALKEREKVRQDEAEHVAKLRGLRLAKEASDKKAAEIADAEAAKSKKSKK